MPTSVLDRLAAVFAGAPPVEFADSGVSRAAVAMLLAPNPDQVLVIRRSERSGDPWSGHLALPGGRRDPDDVDLLDTAIRETSEETGVTVRRDELRATLDDLAPRSEAAPSVIVRPFLFLLESASDVQLNAEVAHAGWIPLERFLIPGVLRTRDVESRGRQFTATGYELDAGFLWGMTERVLTPVLDKWNGLRLGDS